RELSLRALLRRQHTAVEERACSGGDSIAESDLADDLRGGLDIPSAHAGMYFNRTTSLSTRSQLTRRSGGASVRYGVPVPSTTGGRYTRYSSIRPSFVRLCASVGPATSISPSISSLILRIAFSRSSRMLRALGPTDSSERETTHFGWRRHAAAKACSSASQSGWSSSQ